MNHVRQRIVRHRMLVALLIVIVGGLGLMIVGAIRSTPPEAAQIPGLIESVSSSTGPASWEGQRPDSAPTKTAAATGMQPTAPLAQSRLDAPLPLQIGTTAAAASTSAAQVQHQTNMRALSIRIPALDVAASIGAATVANGILTPPRSPSTVGMWAGSAPLDASSGTVTLAGHVNWAGMAPFAFANIAYLRPGDLVYTADKDARQTAWRIIAVVSRPKDEPVDTAAFTGTTGPRKLYLITCGGAFDSDASSYEANIYVSATPAK